MSAPATHTEPALYSSGARPQTTLVFGLSPRATVYAGCGFLIGLLLVLFIHVAAGLAFMGLSATLLVPLMMAPTGRSLYEGGHLAMQWGLRRLRRSTEYHAGPHSRIPGGRYKLPGLLADTTLHIGTDRLGNEFGMIHNKRTNQYTVVIDVLPGGDEAFTRYEKDMFTADWGVFLADLGLHGDIDGAVAVVENIPATHLQLEHSLAADLAGDAPEIAKNFVMQSAALMPEGRHRTLARLSITFRATTRERQRDPEAMATEIARRLPALYEPLSGAGINAQPMTAEEIVATAHRCYNPSTEADFEQAEITGEAHGVEWEDAGPGRASTKWSSYIHDGAVSVVWEMTSPPASVFTDTLLKPLLEPHIDVSRKRLTMIYRPYSAADAHKKAEARHRDAVNAQRNRVNRISSAAVDKRVALTKQTEEELVRGAGQLRYSSLLTLTVADNADLPNAAAIIESLSGRARLKVRRAYGFQDAAFAAGIGLGVLLPDAVTTSALVARD